MKIHKKPYTDDERVADGQRRFEFHDEHGHCIYHCYRHHFWQAHRAWKYHCRRMQEIREQREEAKRRMRQVVEEFRESVELAERKEQIRAGAIGFNELTFFDLE